MKKRAQSTRDRHERRLESARHVDQPLVGTGRESKPSRETFPARTKKPGEVGLANEMRPGLGTRARQAKNKNPKPARQRHDKEPLGRVAPLPPTKPRASRREPPADAFAREQEHDTGVSGHASAD